jgi:hypothetical protein
MVAVPKSGEVIVILHVVAPTSAVELSVTPKLNNVNPCPGNLPNGEFGIKAGISPYVSKATPLVPGGITKAAVIVVPSHSGFPFASVTSSVNKAE